MLLCGFLLLFLLLFFLGGWGDGGGGEGGEGWVFLGFFWGFFFGGVRGKILNIFVQCIITICHTDLKDFLCISKILNNLW